MKRIVTVLIIAFITIPLMVKAEKGQTFEVSSPNGAIILKVEATSKVVWSVQLKGQQIIAPSVAAMTLQTGEILGNNPKVATSKVESVNSKFNTVNYKKSVVNDVCKQLTLICKGDYGMVFRVYDDAVAYRFFTKKQGKIVVMNEEANFNFTSDYKAFIPVQWDYRDGKNFNSSFEALYREINISQLPKDSLAFLPLLVDLGQDVKAEILEADLEDYPGMYLDLNQTGKGFKGVFAPYPLEILRFERNLVPTKRADYIASTSGTRSFPWRTVVITTQDKDLLSCDAVQKLASPNKLADVSWIKPGQVAWDWWNDWNLTHVNFKAGINTETYKYYIDFASANKLPYIIMDEGWTTEEDLTVTKPIINLDEIVSYGKQKNVGVILWATWRAISEQKEKAFPYFSKMGIKGFKIDFFDRDDQIVVASTYEIAKLAAENKLMVDFHGIYKPTGLQRTYPNVVGYEGVKGLENYKWANEDQPNYCVTLPFIRQVAGPMDYTPGAMRNANQDSYRPVNSNPMSKGTRCNQLAMYVVFEAPLQMLSDNPQAYMKEQEVTDFITSIPSVTDETVPLDGKVGEYVAIARRKGDTWYVGAMTDWTRRELTLDFSFLGEGNYQAVIFKDGMNAERNGTDYAKDVVAVKKGDKLKIQLASGGGWAARLEKK